MILLAIVAVLIVLFIVLPLVGFALWTIISALVVGLIFGALGRLIVPGRQNMGLLATAVIGWLAAFIGGIIGHAAFGNHHGWATLLIEIGAAVVGVAAYSSQRRSVGSGSSRGVLDI